MCLDVLHNFFAFQLEKFNKLCSFKMEVKAMAKIVVHGCEYKFNLGNQTQSVQHLNNKIGVVCYTMDIVHKWSIFLHQLGHHHTFHTMKDGNFVYSKTN
jgi:hypothetical protein